MLVNYKILKNNFLPWDGFVPSVTKTEEAATQIST